MIARHMDLLLKRSSRNKGEDLEEKMDEAITVFRFIKDKDTFLKVCLFMPIGLFIEFLNVFTVLIEK
jgi:hypothetical protein